MVNKNINRKIHTTDENMTLNNIKISKTQKGKREGNLKVISLKKSTIQRRLYIVVTRREVNNLEEWHKKLLNRYLKKNMTWMIVSVIVNDNSYNYKGSK